MPHPRSKGSTGYPDAIKDTAHFRSENYRGHRLALGHGRRRLRDAALRVSLPRLFDEMSNWIADWPMPLKYMQAISEARSDIGERGKPPDDDIYANAPVNYVKLDTAADGRRHEPDHQRA